MTVPPDAAAVPPAATGPRADAGVIHDIGYRGYQGPRLGRSYATRSLFTQGLRGAFGLGRAGRSKVLPMLIVAAMALPAAALVAITVLQHGDRLVTDYPQYLDGVGLLFAEIFVAAQAPVLLSRDLRNHTVPLYFSRPITRTDYVRAKAAAMVCALLLVMASPLLILYVGALLGGLDIGHNTAHLGFGLLAALLYAVVFSAVGLLVAAATPRRGFGVAAIMGLLVVSQLIASILSALLDNRVGDSSRWPYLLSPSSLVRLFTNQVCGLARQGGAPGTPAGAVGAAVFGLAIAGLVAGSYGLLLRRYRNI
ncbi:ABC transporter permease [Kitasatospora sp. NPDC052896]|uniref:ABC transporter permease n=1 Tax=Kitasatospora sp. NPDC052896 TaxID=3364061 RepID=UPI0037C5C1B3